MSNHSQIKFGVLFAYVNIASTIVISLIYTPFLLRMMGQGEYGLFSIAFATIGVFSVLDLGLGNANIRYTAKCRATGEKEKEQALHGMFFLLYLAIGVIVFIVGLILFTYTKAIFGQNMSPDEVSKLQKMLLFVVISVSISFPLSVFGFIVQGYERFVFAKLTELLRILLIPFTAVLLLFFGYRSVEIIAAIAIINVLLLTLNLIYCIKFLNVKLMFSHFDKNLLREIMGYSIFVFLNVLAFRINSNSNHFILGIVSGSVSVAVYALAFNLIINFRILSTAISGVFLPVITRIPDDENQIREYNNYFTAIGRLQFYVLALFILGFIFFGRQFITLWAGADYQLSYWIALILISTLSIFLIQSVGLSILQAQNKHKFSSLVFISLSAFNIGLSIFLSKQYGAIGGAVSLAITWLIGHAIVLNIYYARKIKLNIAYFWQQIMRITPAFIPSIIFGMLYLYFYNANTWLNLGIGVFIFTIIYGFCIIFLSFNKFEKETILQPAIRLIFKVIK
jgi:O-antigen/teichoic acid export membrane protein